MLTRLLEPSIVDGGRIVFLSSVAHSYFGGTPSKPFDWDNVHYTKPNSYDPWQAYGRSKLANIFDAQEFAKRLGGRGIITYAVHPRAVKTELMRNLSEGSFFTRTVLLLRPILQPMAPGPLEGSLTALKCAIDPALAKPELTAEYWADLKETKPSALALDPANAPKYWTLTEEMLEAKLGKKVDGLIP